MSNARTNRFDKNAAVKVQGLSVEVRNGDVNKALRRFKKKVQEDGLLQNLREREHYEKPTAKRKKAKAAARARHLKEVRKNAENRG
jgi:small subunit ribosomal protein S21